MTERERELRELVVSLAKRYEGIVQGSVEHRLLIDCYNSWFQDAYPEGWKAKYTDRWCMEAVDAWAIMARTISVVPNTPDTKTAVTIAKSRGQWRFRDYTPQPADLILFDWGGDGLSDHVGYVVSANDTEIVTIEGNAQNTECRSNVYERTDSRILGFCVPDYASLVVDPIPPKPEYADGYSADITGDYTVTTGLYLRPKPSGLRYTAVMPKGSICTADGWYADKGTTRWFHVTYAGLTGWCSSKYLNKV